MYYIGVIKKQSQKLAKTIGKRGEKFYVNEKIFCILHAKEGYSQK